ncbi:hypothetical protein D3C87_1617180 [compost metagenome]
MTEEGPEGKKRVYKKDIFGNLKIEDERGNTVRSVKTDIFGNVTEEGPEGKKRVYKKNIFGDLEIQDENGKVIGRYRTDIFGNKVFETN